MYLFELAMELDVRSADMADAAPELGLEGISPAGELTAEQVAVLRARFTKAPVSAGPGGPPGGSSYTPPSWGPPTGPAIPPPVASSDGGPGIGQIVLIALVVCGVLGLGAFMVKKSRADQERRERIAARAPEDTEVPTTGPDGKPLTDEQRFNLAKMEAARAAQAERACSVLRDIRNADIAMSNATDAADSLDELKALMVDASNQSLPLYDQAIPVIPEQADNMRKLQQFSRDTVATVQAAADPADLQQRLQALTSQAVGSGVTAAAASLDAYAQETCGFSTGNN